MTPELKTLLAKIVDLLADYLETEVEPPAAEEEAPKAKRGRPRKTAIISEKVMPDEYEEDFDNDEEEEKQTPKKTPPKVAESDVTDEIDEEDEIEDDDEEIEEDEAEEGLSEKELTTVKAGLNAFSAKHGREKAVKMLRKFAPTVTRLKAADVKPLLALLKKS